jgi:hypothetical protein
MKSDLSDAALTDHARRQMVRRGIQESQIRSILSRAESVLPVRAGRVVVHGYVTVGDPPRDYLLRVFVDTDRRPAEVVTV